MGTGIWPVFFFFWRNDYRFSLSTARYGDKISLECPLLICIFFGLLIYLLLFDLLFKFILFFPFYSISSFFFFFFFFFFFLWLKWEGDNDDISAAFRLNFQIRNGPCGSAHWLSPISPLVYFTYQPVDSD